MTAPSHKLYRDGEYAGSVNVFQGWNLVAALSARPEPKLTIEEHAAVFVGLPRAA